MELKIEKNELLENKQLFYIGIYGTGIYWHTTQPTIDKSNCIKELSAMYGEKRIIEVLLPISLD